MIFPLCLSRWKTPIIAGFPRVKTYINCYSNNDHCLHQLIEKLTGRSTFKGHSPVDAFCGKWDAHL